MFNWKTAVSVALGKNILQLQEISGKGSCQIFKKRKEIVPKPVFVKQCLNIQKDSYVEKIHQ